MTVVLTRGLAAAVLATLPAQYNLPYADLFVSMAIVVIITTAVIATIGSTLIARRGKNGKTFILISRLHIPHFNRKKTQES